MSPSESRAIGNVNSNNVCSVFGGPRCDLFTFTVVSITLIDTLPRNLLVILYLPSGGIVHECLWFCGLFTPCKPLLVHRGWRCGGRVLSPEAGLVTGSGCSDTGRLLLAWCRVWCVWSCGFQSPAFVVHGVGVACSKHKRTAGERKGEIITTRKTPFGR